MESSIATLIRAALMIVDMDIRVLDDGRVEIIDIPMRGVSDPYDVADAAYHFREFFIQDRRVDEIPADLDALAKTSSIWAKMNPPNVRYGWTAFQDA